MWGVGSVVVGGINKGSVRIVTSIVISNYYFFYKIFVDCLLLIFYKLLIKDFAWY